MTKQADLIAYVFAGQPHLLSADLLQWMAASTRFTAFVETYRDKIRKKMRVTRTPEGILDLRGELQVAYCLLNDRRLGVAYEPYASVKRHSPDFAVTYRSHLVFNIEVTRLRVEANGTSRVATGAGIDLPRKEERILRILLDKLGQMQPGIPDLLVAHTREQLARSIDLAGLIQAVKTRADGKDPACYSSVAPVGYQRIFGADYEINRCDTKPSREYPTWSRRSAQRHPSLAAVPQQDQA